MSAPHTSDPTIRAEIGGETLEVDPRTIQPEAAARIAAMVAALPEDQLRPAVHVLYVALRQLTETRGEAHADLTTPVSYAECSPIERELGRQVAAVIAERAAGDLQDALVRVCGSLVHITNRFAKVAHLAAGYVIAEWDARRIATNGTVH